METKLKQGWIFLQPQDEAATTLWEGLLLLTKHLKGRVLDAGCGNGDYSLRLKEIPRVTEIISVDIVSSDTVLWGKRFCDNVPSGVYIQADLQDLNMLQDASFDGILAWHVIEHCKEPRRVLKEFARLLRGDGLVFIATPTPMSFDFDAYNQKFRGTSHEHYRNWTPEDLEREAQMAGLYPVTPIYIDWLRHQNRLFVSGFETVWRPG